MQATVLLLVPYETVDDDISVRALPSSRNLILIEYAPSPGHHREKLRRGRRPRPRTNPQGTSIHHTPLLPKYS